MYFHTLDYMLFLGLALLAFWGLLASTRFAVAFVLVGALAYFGAAWDGNYAVPIGALLLLDLAGQEGTLRQRLQSYLSRGGAGRAMLLFVLSCAFYMAWQANYVWLILASTCIDYFVGLGLSKAEAKGARRALLALSLMGNLGMLFAFKYYNFFAEELGAYLIESGMREEALPLLQSVLPVGISFYTFQTLSYTIDIYRGTLKPARDFITFAAFVTYFPQLVAGPIVRASELLPQLHKRPRVTRHQVSDGLFLIATGLVKKLAIADYLALGIVDRVFVEPEKFSALEVVVALYAFTMQLYCDFSGYTDIARGSAKLMGYELPLNFDRPYQAANPADFWRRWHMTLSRWLRDYLYFPLGGSRCSPPRAYFNLFLTMFLVGIWHGSSVNFEVFFWYALLQSAAVVGHRFWRKRFPPKPAPAETEKLLERSRSAWMRTVLFVFLNLQFVVFSRILFRAGAETDPMATASGLLDRLMTGNWSAIQVPLGMWTLLVATFVLHFIPRKHFDFAAVSFRRVPVIWKGVLLAGVAFLLIEVASREAVPFQYFQF
ncbi:MAG: MBOAT family O-acyltransferase [Myxococcota bacterium]